MVALDVTGTEYREVKALFEVTVPVTQVRNVWTPSSRQDHGYKIVKIQRVQNPQLYHQYVIRKKGMDQQNPSGYQNEMRLFHGCPKSVTEQISHQGFNRSFAVQNGKIAYVHVLHGVYVCYTMAVRDSVDIRRNN